MVNPRTNAEISGGLEVAVVFFGIDYNQASQLFLPYSNFTAGCLPANASAKRVAARIRKFVKQRT